jgi:ribosomal protein L11 methyltransferase
MTQTCFRAEIEKSVALSLQKIFEVEFEEDGFPVSSFEDLDNPVNWEIAVYCDTELAEETHARMQRLASEANIRINFDRDDLEDKDWVAETLRELTAVRAGRFIVHGSHEKHIPAPHEIAIHVNAGLAFGTGHHGTTAGCLEMLSRVIKRKTFRNVLDLGTGSGVLAIAAAKAMPCFVMATDIDPVATQTAKFNCKQNGVQAHIECLTSTGFTHRRMHEQAPFDLVIANILARPLQQMALDIVAHTAPGGTVILSRLLPHQRTPIIASFRLQGLPLTHSHIRDGWLILVFEKT